MSNPKCPDCGKRLVKISGTDKEYICVNNGCPANIKSNKDGVFSHVEYYGTQEEINKQKQSKIKIYNEGIPENIFERKENGKNTICSTKDIVSTFNKNIINRLEKYIEILMLGKQGVSAKEISNRTEFSESSIRGYLHGKYAPNFYKEVKKCSWLPLKTSKELAYLCGFLFGDGHIRKELSSSTFYNKNLNLLNTVNEYLEIVFEQKQHLSMKILTYKIDGYICRNKKRYSIDTNSLIARAFYSCSVPKGNKTKQNITIPKWIQNNEIYLRYFLAAIFDSEGCVNLSEPNRRKIKVSCSLSMKNKKFIKELIYSFNNLGITTSKESKNRKNMYRFYINISIDNMIRLYTLIPLKHPNKKKNIEILFEKWDEYYMNKNLCPRCRRYYIYRRKRKTPTWYCPHCHIEFDESLTWKKLNPLKQQD